MRPEKQRQSSRRAALARARMYLKARLYWLPGFPLQRGEGWVAWVCLFRHSRRGPERILLEREHLHQATYTLSKLVHRFPRLVPYLVEDDERWIERTPHLLEWLKEAIHEGNPLPPSLLEVEGAFGPGVVDQAASLSRRYPALRPLLNALSWSLYLTPREFSPALAWLESEVETVEALLAAQPGMEGLVSALAVWDLTRLDGPRRVAPLLHFLKDPRFFTLPIQGAATYLQQWLVHLRSYRKGKPENPLPEPPPADLGLPLLRFAAWLSQQEQTTRRRALDLLGLTLPRTVLDPWERWWTETQPLLTQARHLTRLERNRLTRGRAKELAAELEAHLQKIPFPLPLQELIDLISQVSLPEQASFYEQCQPTLKKLPEPEGPTMNRAAFLRHWTHLANWPPGRMTALLPHFRAFLSKYGHIPNLLSPWHEIFQPQRHGWPLTASFLDRTIDSQLWPAMFEAIARCCTIAKEPLNREDGELIIGLVEVTGDASQASAYFFELDKAGLRDAYLSEKILNCAHRLDRGQGQFGRLVAILEPVGRESWTITETIMAVTGQLDESGWTNLARALILDGKLTELVAVGQRSRLLGQLGGQVEPPPQPLVSETPAWGRRYPEIFGPLLANLSALTPEAEAIAGRVLDEFFPASAKIEQEVSVLQDLLAERPDDVKLARRLANLQTRLEAPVSVSAARLARLEEKLRWAVRRTLLQVWQDRVEQALQTRLAELLGLPEAPAWLFEPQNLRALAAILKLSPLLRKLGLDLLRRRCGPPPWRPLEAPANQAFVARLRRLKINPEPWLNPPGPQAHLSATGQTLYLAFEDDPLEIFQMGAHFNTCLSPGEFNFFSVIANTTDINKRVLYARDQQGRVVGRCLLALGEAGELLTFEPYCHDKSLGFDKLVGELAGTLALQMGTLVTIYGKVSNLVAPEWYDDGTRDLCNRFNFLQPGSEFRQALREVEPEALVPMLEAGFAPLPLNALSLALVLELPELRERPELALPLLPRLERCTGLPESAWLRAALLAHQAGALDFARRVLRSQAVPYLLQFHRRYGNLNPEMMQLLTALEPSAALQILRRTRPRGIRHDEEELDPERRQLLARAYQALSRPVQAQRLRPIQG